MSKKDEILNELRNSYPNQTWTAKELSIVVGISETSDTCPTTRGYIRDLIDDGHVIGSSRDGYKLLQTGKEVQAYLNSLLERQMGISRRIAAVYEAAKINKLL